MSQLVLRTAMAQMAEPRLSNLEVPILNPAVSGSLLRYFLKENYSCFIMLKDMKKQKKC